MFSIGEFSRLTGVSIKMLRHYDKIDLFKPAKVDTWTNYRYYTYDQFPRLNRLLALKGLGLSLEQVRQVLDDSLSADELRGMLRLRQAQLEQQMDETREMLYQVEVRLKQIEQEGKLPNIEILTKQVDKLTIVGARELVPSPDLMRERCIALNGRAEQLIQKEGLKTDNISFALYYSGGDDGIDVEMAYVVDPASDQTLTFEQAKVHQLPAVTVAYAVYQGSFDDFAAVGQLHGTLHQWCDENGYRVVAPSREFYLQPPQSSDDPTGVMEIQFPIVKE